MYIEAKDGRSWNSQLLRTNPQAAQLVMCIGYTCKARIFS